MNDSVQLFDKQLSIVTKPIPKITNSQDVLVKVAFSGVSDIDLHILSGRFPASNKAVTLGHEISGIIHGIGSEVTHLAVGDRVVIKPNNNCHICSHCAEGDPHFCKTGGILSTVGIWKNGGWANYCRVAGSLVYKIPDYIPLNKAVLVEPLSKIANGWHKLGLIKPNAKVLVCGGGIIGILWTSFLHFHGVCDLYVSEICEKQRTLLPSLQLGLQVHHPDYLMESCRKAARDGDEDWGFDVIVECTGKVDNVEQAFKWLRRGAKMLLFGNYLQGDRIKLNPFDMYYKEIQLIGSFSSHYTYPSVLSLVRRMNEYLDFGKLGVNIFQLQDYPAALEALKAGIASKAIFQIGSL